MQFRVLQRSASIPNHGVNTVYLSIDNWNDYSFVTQFGMSLHDENGVFHSIGPVKIGFKGQTTSIDTHMRMNATFEKLDDNFFSLGQSTDFYRSMNKISHEKRSEILSSIRDVVFSPEIIDKISDEKVFSNSLLRGISRSVIRGQFERVLYGKAELTDYKFSFIRPETEDFGAVDLSFNVVVDSRPSTNIHALIGRNGVGKTTLLNGMIDAILKKTNIAKFIDYGGWNPINISDDYFSSLVSVSFSAFDPFNPPLDQPDPAKGTCYFYIGLKDPKDSERQRTISELHNDCVKALITCFYQEGKTQRWLAAIEKLGSDENFSSMALERLQLAYVELRREVSINTQSDSEEFKEKFFRKVKPYLSRMSSGHAIVLLTITKLVATVEEKTLVLLDEPESHLHPPLLSAFIRALADLLHDRNGVALVATHSPVILQEIPRSCAWKIYRIGKSVTYQRPTIETFGENLGLLTSEVFSLEVERSGFHDLLANSVNSGESYDEIVRAYNEQLGFEARAILKSLVTSRDRSLIHDAT
jgi:predicted ATPase